MGHFIPPFRIHILSKLIKNNQKVLKILDIGCGNNSPTITKKAFPNAHYTGIDIDKSYNISQKDIELTDTFIQMDLNQFNESVIPDNQYDIIIMSHIIEHLIDGDIIIEKLMPKLKSTGLFYIEFPSEKSVFFPSMKGTLNFFDDNTHVRIYSVKEICNLFMKKMNNETKLPEFKIIKAGIVRQPINILFLPLKVIQHLIKFGHCKAGIFWDLYGFANYVIAQKK